MNEYIAAQCWSYLQEKENLVAAWLGCGDCEK